MPILVLALVASAVAGSWPESRGHAQIIYSVSWFQSAYGYGPKGEVSRYGSNGLFTQFQMMPYFDVGITNRTSLTLNPTLTHLSYNDKFNSNSSGGFGDVEISVRRALTKRESGWLLAGQGTWKFPGYSSALNPAPGNHQDDFEGRFMVGRSGKFVQKQAFADLEAGYRYRAGAPADQVRTDATGGIAVLPRLTLMAQFFGITSMRNGSAVRPNSNPNAQSDFDLYKGQASAVIKVTRANSVQLGWVNTFAGRNTGKGSTIVIALWRSF